MNKFFVCLAAGTAFVAVPAMAQSEESPFTGPRVEAVVGYDISKAGSRVDDDINADNDESIDGFLYGVGVGYDHNFNGAVIGVEAELTDSTAKTKFDEGDFEGFGIGNVRANRDIYVGARIGGQVTPTTLLYAKGGYTNAKFDVRSFDGTQDLRQDIDTDGYRLGAGVEQAINDRTFVKLEYRYSNYSKAEIDFEGELPDSERFDVDFDRHQVVLGAGIRF